MKSCPKNDQKHPKHSILTFYKTNNITAEKNGPSVPESLLSVLKGAVGEDL